ncbi:uncharacterized protein MONBRDRAFT_22421 [Monosiga brevicollis MX1]|uniref:RING-type domain-containing protein n=1 Tax=Monosiga brevicollis TaxID=81824 RepID=A9UQI9_MONBE|nr:uncharacterized protein MONBRDRAFT_22421 [Monosiga brevicollis MX1]EDQ92606.1 predicted protein [Monosiga brevicollis MX1]|eukprot:XP_001742368.1 hypothetical protein [Monosiga brevicollis MX1]
MGKHLCRARPGLFVGLLLAALALCVRTTEDEAGSNTRRLELDTQVGEQPEVTSSKVAAPSELSLCEQSFLSTFIPCQEERLKSTFQGETANADPSHARTFALCLVHCVKQFAACAGGHSLPSLDRIVQVIKIDAQRRELDPRTLYEMGLFQSTPLDVVSPALPGCSPSPWHPDPTARHQTAAASSMFFHQAAPADVRRMIRAANDRKLQTAREAGRDILVRRADADALALLTAYRKVVNQQRVDDMRAAIQADGQEALVVDEVFEVDIYFEIVMPIVPWLFSASRQNTTKNEEDASITLQPAAPVSHEQSVADSRLPSVPELLHKVQDTQSQLMMARDEMQAMDRGREQLEQQLRAREGMVASLEKRCTKLAQQARDRSETVEQLEGVVRDRKQQLHERGQEVARCQALVSQLRRDLAQKDQLLQDALRATDELQSRLDVGGLVHAFPTTGTLSLDRLQAQRTELHEALHKTEDLILQAKLAEKVKQVVRHFETERQEEQACRICLHHQINVALQPCGHLAVCQQCAELLPDALCPMCRAVVESTVDVYYA